MKCLNRYLVMKQWAGPKLAISFCASKVGKCLSMILSILVSHHWAKCQKTWKNVLAECTIILCILRCLWEDIMQKWPDKWCMTMLWCTPCWKFSCFWWQTTWWLSITLYSLAMWLLSHPEDENWAQGAAICICRGDPITIAGDAWQADQERFPRPLPILRSVYQLT